MVNDHSLKTRARQLMAESKGTLSYTDAVKLAKNLSQRSSFGIREDDARIVFERRTPDADPATAQLVNELILRAIRAHASDIHLELTEGSLAIRYRIEGSTYSDREISPELGRSVLKQLKDLASTSRPGGGEAVGSIHLAVDGHDAKLRFAHVAAPAIPGGEWMNLRVIAPHILEASKVELAAIEAAAKVIDAGRDLIIFGGAGAGKSTAIHRVLSAARGSAVLLGTDGQLFELEVAERIAATLREKPQSIAVGKIRNVEAEASLDRPAYRWIRSDSETESWLASSEIPEIVGFDEVRAQVPNLVEKLSLSRSKVLTVHALQSSDLARGRIQNILPELELNDPAFLEVTVTGQGADRVRHYELYS